ncbi:YibE/F family protein [Actinoplanes couchii]|uniref:Membrane protein n=1 Tax=Actinoplanes couchii TaxID=403638 RepID=A0ABQ3X0F4_9ACTN|nr:YibE/F family protein [Actinoplanes couchii]MDR6316271.1 putative membrane protein [Actinoplanes couchii]GID51885.1 membrane protein [Actinoplanes couchii]
MSADHHSHAHGDLPALPGGRRVTLYLLVPAVLLTLLGMLLLWPRDVPAVDGGTGPVMTGGEVMTMTPVACPEVPAGDTPEVNCGTLTVRLDSGATITTEIPSGPGAPVVGVGDDVALMQLNGEDGATTYAITDHQRGTELWMLGLVFALAVIAFGRWRGLTALAGLAITFGILLWFIVPAILDGKSPIMVAVVGSAAIMLIVLYLTHGLSITTSIAVAGTLVSLAITAVLAAISTAAVHLTGVSDETSNFLTITHGDVNMQGLLLAGIVIGSLGVLDDVTVTQSATVTELALANPAYGFRRLYGAATRIGRAHIASVINTIVLAYAGASLPLMLLFAAGNTPVGEVLTTQLIAEELVRSAVGTIGLVAAVPITTALAAWYMARHHRPDAPGRKPDGPEKKGPAKHRERPAEDPWQAFVER